MGRYGLKIFQKFKAICRTGRDSSQTEIVMPWFIYSRTLYDLSIECGDTHKGEGLGLINAN
jgi:hypothetical protein